MTQIFEFVIIVIVISASGVMAPGPLFAANVSYGLREGTKSGVKMAIGHTICRISFSYFVRNRRFFFRIISRI